MDEHIWDETCDVVVVGAGTGLAAAISAADVGLKTIVVEKTDYLGGSTARSGGGLWMPGNAVLRETGIRDTHERVQTYLDKLVGDTAPRERRVSFLDHAPAAFEVLQRRTPLKFSHMPDYADYFSDTDGGSAVGRSIEPMPFDMASLGDDEQYVRPTAISSPVPMPITSVDYKWMNLMVRSPLRALPKVARRLAQGIGGKLLLRRNYVAGGQAVAAGLIAGARDVGVEMWRNSPLRDLVIEGERVVGVVVERDGREIRIAATRGVILAAGGFDHNIQMRHKYQSEALKAGWSFGSPGNTGEVLEIAERHGVALTLMDQSWWFPAIPPVEDGGAPSVMLAERSLPGSMIVDSAGYRFFNEACDYMTAGQIMLGFKDGEQHVPAWLIFDQKYRNSYVFGGGIMPGMKLPQAWYDAGVAFRGRSIVDLAEKLGMPRLPDALARFNVLAAQGNDDDFSRGQTYYDRYYGDPTNTPNPNLRPLTDAPFYAVQVVPGDLGTCGGIEADEYARALRADGSIIDGLYACGNIAGNAFGHFYPGAGATIGQGITFGFVAAMHAAGRLSPTRTESMGVRN